MEVDRLQVIFKIVERCNINCSYCYYFNMGDTRARYRPPLVSVETAGDIASWLAVGCRELAVKELTLCFHGGEPMMIGPERLDAICSLFRTRLAGLTELSFIIQTNGTILTAEWLWVLCKHSVHVGVSIDGDATANDRFRLDHHGRSTFDRIVENLTKLVEAGKAAEHIGPSVISVLDIRNDYLNIYRYFRRLGIRQMNFLLPDRAFDDGFGNNENAQQYGAALLDIFKAWMAEDDPQIHVRFIREVLRHFQFHAGGRDGSDPGTDGRRSMKAGRRFATQIVVVHSDGRVGVSDSYIPALSWFRRSPESFVAETTLGEFLANDIFDEIQRLTTALPAACRGCEWRRICKGGDLENRYSKHKGFDNPSVYCDGYKWLFTHMCGLLVEKGYPSDHLQRVLNGENVLVVDA